MDIAAEAHAKFKALCALHRTTMSAEINSVIAAQLADPDRLLSEALSVRIAGVEAGVRGVKRTPVKTPAAPRPFTRPRCARSRGEPTRGCESFVELNGTLDYALRQPAGMPQHGTGLIQPAAGKTCGFRRFCGLQAKDREGRGDQPTSKSGLTTKTSGTAATAAGRWCDDRVAWREQLNSAAPAQMAPLALVWSSC
jgi:hypothetical protein